MTHEVCIYKLHSKEGETSFGVPGQREYYYNDVPDLDNVSCYVQRSGSPFIETGQPFDEIIETIKIFFPKEIEIKEKDKIVFNGAEFYLNISFEYRTHLEVEAWRVRKQ